MCAHNVLCETQSQTGTRYLMTDGRASIESLKYSALLGRRYPLALIGHCDRNDAAAVAHVDFEWCFRGGILQRIIHELLNGELEQSLINCNSGRRLAAFKFNGATIDFASHRPDY